MNTSTTSLFLVGASLLIVLATTADAQTTLSYPEMELSLQPIVTEMETDVPTSAYGTDLSDPDGTETLWCNGRPSYWVVGGMEYLHPDHVEGPLCYNSADQTWTSNDSTLSSPPNNGLDTYYDPPTNTQPIDRRDCLRMDVNNDSIQDIVCVVGDDGYKNELYLTQVDGKISKVPDGHGLQNYPGSGSKYIEKLKSYNGVDNLVFVVGDNDNHHMYKTLPNFPYFVELPGSTIYQPWLKSRFAITSDPIIFDLNGDDVDDMIVYDEMGQSRMFVQNKDDGNWDEITLPDFKLTSYWKSARIERISSPTVDPYPDLVVTWNYQINHYVHVFGGMANAPYFDFRRPIYSHKLDTAGSDVEVVDVNDDGNLDLYIVQRINDDSGCSKDYNSPDNKPPLNNSRDFLLLNNGNTALSGSSRNMFTKYKMDFKGRGCGGLVRKFGDTKSLILTEGSSSHVGYNYLLEWPTSQS